MYKYIWLLFPLVCGADVLYVPDDYAAIQDALNAIADSDTVLVDIGVYAEALQAPNLRFVLKGNVEPDTGDYSRPIVDPSSLPNPTTLACLTLQTGSHAVIEDFVFHNGPEMFPGRPANSVGGVRNHSMNAAFRRCLFDSTIFGLRPNPGRLRIEQCEFRDITRICVHSYTPTTTRISAVGCVFSKIPNSGGYYLANFDDSSVVSDCWFKETVGTSMIWISGSGVTIRNCLFGAAPSLTNEVVYGFSLRGCRIENSIFTDLSVQMAIGNLSCIGEPGDTCFIRGNSFIGNHATFVSGGAGLILHGSGPPGTLIVEHNVFDSCVGGSVYDAIDVQAPFVVRHNRITGGAASSAAAVFASLSYSQAELTENLFTGTENAVSVQGASTFNAEWNWWGDSTGPYHSTLNPEGMGDQVEGSVDFTPWHTDTLFFLDTPERPPQLPDGFQLEVFPNPFNAVGMLRMFVDEPGLYSVDAYNLLGQHVEKIWSGPLAVDKQLAWNAADLPSGIYFVRVWQTIGNRPRAMQKVVLLK